MKRLLALLLLSLMTVAGGLTSAHAQTAKPKPAPKPPAAQAPGQAGAISVEILWFGVVSGEKDKEKSIENTDRVPARMGTEFGVAFSVSGVPDGTKVTLHQVARYPAPGRRIAESGKLQKTEEADTECEAGETCFTSYNIEMRDEIIPGEWTLELQYGGKKVMEQKFVMRYEGI